jgi:hypothetical protein
MLLPIVTLYFLGLILLLFSDSIGLGLFRFRTVSVYLGVLIGYLTFISSYALFKGNGNSVGIFVFLWLMGFVFFIHGKKDLPLMKRQDYLQRLLIICLLWSAIFLLKVSYFWNSEYNSPNLLFADYEFYMKIAEGYNLSGNENAMGLRNMLFPFLDFAQPYRSSDFWLVSLGLDLTKMDTIYIWELFYSTMLLFICSLSLFVLLKRKFNLFVSLILSVLLLFAFSGHWYRDVINLLYSRNSGSYDPIGIIAYTKLAIVFSIVFQFFLKYEMGKKMEAVYLLMLIPVLVQSAIAVFVLIPLIILFFLIQDMKLNANNFKKYLPLIVIFTFLVGGIFLFYFLNQQKEQLYMGYSNLKISNNENVMGLIFQFFKKSTLMFISYFWLSFLLATFLLFSTKSLNKGLRQELFVLMLLCYFSSTLVYALYNKIGDAYQFSTNVFGPFILSLIIYLFIQTPVNTLLGKLKMSVLLLISILGMIEMIGGSNVFHSTTRINYYSKEFISKVKTALPRLDYPLGIIYYGKDLQDYSKEDFPQHDATFLKLFGRNYDVFNIEADSLKLNNTDKSFQKINFSIKRNALNIWQYNSRRITKSKKNLSRNDFYATYPFSFCISKKSMDSLPEYIKLDIVSVLKDDKSKVYFYTLDRKYSRFKNSNK